MTREIVNRIALPVPLILSLSALALALGSVIAGGGRGADEGWQAHLWQLLMVVQFPVIVAFVLTSDWRQPRRPLAVVALYAAAIMVASVPVATAGL